LVRQGDCRSYGYGGAYADRQSIVHIGSIKSGFPAVIIMAVRVRHNIMVTFMENAQ
jgi:hypothetical protein